MISPQSTRLCTYIRTFNDTLKRIMRSCLQEGGQPDSLAVTEIVHTSGSFRGDS
jgi:hypothetical protein